MKRELALEDDVRALVVLARSGRDPDLGPFIRGARLGQALLVAPRGSAPLLGYWSPMERGEAASTGLELIDPERLEVARANRDSSSEAEALAWILGRALLVAGVAPGPVALAGSSWNGQIVCAGERLAGDGWRWLDGHGAVRKFRRCKTDPEIDDVARAADATVAAFRLIARMLAEAMPDSSGELILGGAPLTVARLKAEAAASFGRAGLEQPEGGIVAPAEEGAVPHTSGTPDRRLRIGETLVVDLFPRSRLFADCTRTFCVGEPPEAVRRAHREVDTALGWARTNARVGTVGHDLQRGVCDQLKAAGYPTQITDPGTEVGYVHGLGHGVGFELHELPSLGAKAGEAGVLADGDVVTLEPGLYDEQAGYGVRIEDLAVVRSGGLELLTPMPTCLEPVAYLE